MTTHTVLVTEELRDLIRMTRRETAHMTQRAAGKAAGYSAVWWRHIESGAQPDARSDTLARMCYVVDVQPESLDALGFHEVADGVRKRQKLMVTQPLSPYPDKAESYLWEMPETDEGTRRALIAHLRLLREVGGDPAAAQIVRTMRGLNAQPQYSA